MKDPYLYEDVPVLKNKLDIKDQELLKGFEADITAVKFLGIDKFLERFENNKEFSFDYLKELHKYVFEDIYEFAGELRTIPFKKPEIILGGDSVKYSLPDQIQNDAENVIDKMNNTNWSKLKINDITEEFGKSIAALWQTHPFIEGNTRIITTFASHFAETHGFKLDLQLLKENNHYFKNSLTRACDEQIADFQYLNKILKNSIENGYVIDIMQEISYAGYKPTDKLIHNMFTINQDFNKFHSVEDIKSLYKNKDMLSSKQKTTIEKTVNDFIDQEKKENELSKNSPIKASKKEISLEPEL